MIAASIEVSVSLTAPFPDAGGVLQPCYLNANVTLLRQPGQDLQVRLPRQNPASHLYACGLKKSRNAEIIAEGQQDYKSSRRTTILQVVEGHMVANVHQ